MKRGRQGHEDGRGSSECLEELVYSSTCMEALMGPRWRGPWDGVGVVVDFRYGNGGGVQVDGVRGEVAKLGEVREK